MQRDKGKRFEREVAKAFSESGIAEFKNAARSYQQSRTGSDAPDVDGIKTFWIECKVGKCPNIRSAMQQAVADSEGKGRLPVVVSKRDREDTLITFRLAEFFEWIRCRE